MLPFKQRRDIHADLAKELLSQGVDGMHCVNVAHHYTMACKDVEELEIDLATTAIDHWETAVRHISNAFKDIDIIHLIGMSCIQNTLNFLISDIKIGVKCIFQIWAI